MSMATLTLRQRIGALPRVPSITPTRSVAPRPRRGRAALATAAALMLATPVWGKDPSPSPTKAAAAGASASAVSDDLRRAFVTVDGQIQTRAMAEIALRERLARGAPNTPQTLAAVRDSLVDQALMARAAAKAGFDRDPLLEAQAELLRQRLLGQAWQRKVVADLKPTDKDLRAEWVRLNEERGKREVRIRHLLVREEPTARLLVDRVKSGSSMASLAAEYSLDEGTKGEGGLAAWAPEGLLIPALSEAVRPLKKGQLAPAAVQTPAGWHVVQLEDARNLAPTDFEQVRPQLLQRLGDKAVQAQLAAMREAAKLQ